MDGPAGAAATQRALPLQHKWTVTIRHVVVTVLLVAGGCVSGHSVSWWLDVHIGWHLWLYLQRWYIDQRVTDLLHQQQRVNALVWSLGVTSELPAMLLMAAAGPLAVRHRTQQFLMVFLIAFAVGSGAAAATHYLDLVHSVTGIPLPWLHTARPIILGG